MRVTPEILELQRRMESRVKHLAPSLLALHGCGALIAARILAEVANLSRFRSEAAFARYAGLAPVPDQSGITRGRLRNYRGGNRQLNMCIHQISMIQIRSGGPAEEYYRRRRGDRDSHGYALTGVKRRVVRIVYLRLKADQHILSQPPPKPKPRQTQEVLRAARLQRCKMAAKLRDAGLSNAEIAKRIDAEASGVKVYIQDGRFYADPSREPDRLALARRAATAKAAGYSIDEFCEAAQIPKTKAERCWRDVDALAELQPNHRRA